MSKKSKTLIIVFAVLVLLAGAYFGARAYKAKEDTGDLPDSEPSVRLGNLDSLSMSRIEIPALVLERKGELWELVSVDGGPVPGGIELDQSQINSRTYSLSNVWVDRVIEEAPADLAVYGLANPAFRVSVADAAGKKAVYLIGDMTPSRSSYYVMEEGNPRVCTVSAYSVENMQFNLDAIRVKTLFPAFEEFTSVTKLSIESPEGLIDIALKPAVLPPHLSSTFSLYVMTSPYKLIRGVSSEDLQKLIEPLKGLNIDSFVDDLPGSLAPYGLDNPVRIHFETLEEVVDLLVGAGVDGKHYAKRPDAPAVFTVAGLEPVISVKPFTLLDKFPLILNIDNVDGLTVRGGEKALDVTIKGKGDEGVYTLNGKTAETKTFKTFYQAVIGLLSDAEYPGPARSPAPDASEAISIEYQLNTPAGVKTSVTLIPYDRDYYVLRQEGTMEFLVSRNQVQAIYDTADQVVYTQ